MVEQRLDDVFQALGHATRRPMVADLAGRERTVGQLAEPFTISFAAASKHVKVLERAGLVERTISGRTHVCRLAPEPIGEAFRWLATYERFWPERLDAREAELRRADRAVAQPGARSSSTLPTFRPESTYTNAACTWPRA